MAPTTTTTTIPPPLNDLASRTISAFFLGSQNPLPTLATIKKTTYPAMRREMLDANKSRKKAFFSKLSGRERLTKAPSTATMQQFLHHFSEIFFQGQISRTIFEWDDELPGYGLSSCPDDEGTFYITMNPRSCLGETNPAAFMLGTLLHECVHSLFSQVSCPILNEAFFYHFGRTGHGRAWMRVAEHIEGRMKKYVDGKIDLGIDVSLKREVEWERRRG